MDAVGPPKSSPLSGLGPALRRLRMHRGLRQFETAAAAGITKAMLSAYENGKRRPSLKTLDQILAALAADLGDLHHAIALERRERAREERLAAPADPTTSGAAGPPVGPPDELGEPAPRYGDPPPASAPWPEPAWRQPQEVDLYRALGIRAPLPPAEERALSEMLVGFLKLLRFLHAGGEGPRGPFAG